MGDLLPRRKDLVRGPPIGQYIAMSAALDRFLVAVSDELRARGLSGRQAAALAGMPPRTFSSIMGGAETSLQSAEKVCDALNIEFSIGQSSEARRDAPAPFMQGDGDDFTCPWPVPLSSDEADYPESGYAPVGCVWFGSRFLERAGLDPWSCEVARLPDDSMAPSLPEGTFVLVDRRRKRREAGCIYQVRHDRKVLVRQAVRSGSSWELHAAGQGQEVLVWDRRVKAVGQVVWMGRVFVPMVPRDAA